LWQPPNVPRAIATHSSRDYETELRELESRLLAMGARCERVVGLAFAAFSEGTPDVVAALQDLDAEIDHDELNAHALILRILALRQPVADDLRLLTTALRLVTDLERIGDEAVNIGERATPDKGSAKRLAGDELSAMAVAALGMLHGALDAFVRWDDEQAIGILRCDGAVDALCATTIAAMVEHISGHPNDAQAGLAVIRVAKILERIADHATNVAEEVIFMVRADDVRHGKWPPAGAMHVAQAS
jgi:phosphate transport system protein